MSFDKIRGYGENILTVGCPISTGSKYYFFYAVDSDGEGTELTAGEPISWTQPSNLSQISISIRLKIF